MTYTCLDRVTMKPFKIRAYWDPCSFKKASLKRTKNDKNQFLPYCGTTKTQNENGNGVKETDNPPVIKQKSKALAKLVSTACQTPLFFSVSLVKTNSVMDDLGLKQQCLADYVGQFHQSIKVNDWISAGKKFRGGQKTIDHCFLKQ